MDDIVNFENTTQRGRNGTVGVRLSTGAGFGDYQLWSNAFCMQGQFCWVGDSNADGRDDVFMFVRSSSPEPGAGDVWVGTSQ